MEKSSFTAAPVAGGAGASAGINPFARELLFEKEFIELAGVAKASIAIALDKTKTPYKTIISLKPEAFEAIKRSFLVLGVALSKAKSISPTLQGRVNFLGNAIIKHLVQSVKITDAVSIEKYVAGLLIVLAKIKNATQLEVLEFQRMYEQIEYHHKLHVSSSEEGSSSALKELLPIMPDLMTKIRYDISHNQFVIDITPLVAVFDRSVERSGSLEFDKAMLLVMSDFTFTGGKIYIPIKKVPSDEIIDELRKSPDPSVRLLGALLFACKISAKEFADIEIEASVGYQYFDSYQCDEYQAYINGEIKEDRTLKAYYEYTPLAPVIPFFSHMLRKRDEYCAAKKYFSEFLSSKEDCAEILGLAPPEWFEEDLHFYELVLKIENFVLEFLRSRPASYWQELQKPYCDEMIRDSVLVFQMMFEKDGKKWDCPIGEDKVFCSSGDELKRFYLTAQFKEKTKLFLRKEEADDYDDVVVKTSTTRKVKKKNTVHEGGGASASTEATAACAAAGAGTAILPREVALAYKPSVVATKKIDSIIFAPRVQAWMDSIESGLSAHGYNPATHPLAREEMILRHHLPPQIITFLFDEHYSKESRWIKEGSDESQPHFDCVVYINGTKYIVGATLNSRNFLYHLYARPVKKWEDYFTLAKESPSEFPVLGAKPVTVDVAKIKPGAGVVMKEDGNVVIEFEGRTYEVVLLKPF